MRFFYTYLWVTVMLLCPALGPAKAGEAVRHRVVLVVCDRLTWEDINAECPFLVSLMDRSAIGLMNTLVDRGPQNATSATLALALGRQFVSFSDLNFSEPDDEQAFNIAEVVAGQPAMAQPGATQSGIVQSGTAGSIYTQRAGAVPPVGHNIVNINSVSLARRRILEQGLGTALAAATPPRRILICGNADTDTPARRAALLALDAKGTAVGNVALISREDKNKPFGCSDSTTVLARYAATTDADIFVVVLGDLARVEAARRTLQTRSAYYTARQNGLHRLDTFFVQLLAVRHLDTSQIDCLLVSPCPPSVLPSSADNISEHTQTSEVWEQLTPILALGPDFPPGLLASPTTRTAGLVSNLDLAPTILHLLGIPVPSGMIGHTIQSQSAPSLSGMAEMEARQQYISRLDFVTALNAQARTPAINTLIGCWFLLALAALLVCWRHGKGAVRRLSPALIYLLNFPAGCLLATILIPPTLLEYLLRIAAWMLVLTAAIYLLARALRTTSLEAGSLLNISVIVLDLWRGQTLLRDSLLSEFALSGHHNYGAGNVYTVLLLGYALIGGCSLYRLKKKQGSSSSRQYNIENNMKIIQERRSET